MQVFAQSLLFSQGLVYSLGVVACCYDHSTNRNSDCSDYLGYLSIPAGILTLILVPVLICIVAILPLLWLILLIHILGLLYFHMP